MRGEVYRLRAARDLRGSEQAGLRYAIVLQADVLPLSTLLVAPTSRSARPASFRPEVVVENERTRVLVEQTVAVDPTRLGDAVGCLTLEEMRQIEASLRVVLGL